MTAVRFSLLGPLRGDRHGRTVCVPGGKIRALLATLLLRPDQVVPLGLRTERLWGHRPPRRPRRALLNGAAREPRREQGDRPAEAPAFGALLRTWRKRARLTQEQLADRAGLNVRTVRRWEGGATPRDSSLQLLAEALELDGTEQAELVRAADGRAAQVVPEQSPAPPRQLPADAPVFVGRASDLAALTVGAETTAVVITAIDGMAGIGGTTLVVHVARDEPARRHWRTALRILTALGLEPTEDEEATTEGIRAHLDCLEHTARTIRSGSQAPARCPADPGPSAG